MDAPFRLNRFALGLAMGIVFISGCGDSTSPARPTVRLAAAASLGQTLHQLEPRVEDALGVDLVINTGSSGMLARQIELGDSADLFISADADWMDNLEQRGLILKETLHDLWGNQLVVVTPGDVQHPPATPADLTDPNWKPLALGDPAHVPAGKYARQALEHAGVWDQIAPDAIHSSDVVAALAYVSARQCPAAIVYATDVAAAKGVRVAFTIDPALHEPIVYPAAVMKAAGDADVARRVLNWLQSPDAAKAFRDSGFVVLP